MTYFDILSVYLTPTAVPCWGTTAADVAITVFNLKVDFRDGLPGVW